MATIDPHGELEQRRARGAFFTPQPIADFLARWAVREPNATVLDPTCGEAAFLLSSARRLRTLGTKSTQLRCQLFGIDLYQPSLDRSLSLLQAEGLDADLREADIFTVPTPAQFGCPLPEMDAVVGNPPFVRYHEHRGETRRRSISAALAQGVRLSGLASSWAAVVTHACGFLKPSGRLAIVLPAELLTVQYAEPVRRWLRRRFSGVTLVMFEELQFDDALEKVVLVLAHGSGGCESFNLVYLRDTEELEDLSFGDGISVTPAGEGKWTDLMLPLEQRRLYRQVVQDRFVPLAQYGTPMLGGVTGANEFFALSEPTRLSYELAEEDLLPICPPGTRHLKGTVFGTAQWRRLRDGGERVWLFRPRSSAPSGAVANYIAEGVTRGVHEAYKCRIRDPWWRPAAPVAPDIFFTYMSHRYPRLVTNSAKVSFLNSMHGINLAQHIPKLAKQALPLLAFNSVTMLGAEIHGRSYGGGILKMEPTEAAALPMPAPDVIAAAWELLKSERDRLDRLLRDGLWTNVVKHVDNLLLDRVLGLDGETTANIRGAAAELRRLRLGQ